MPLPPAAPAPARAPRPCPRARRLGLALALVGVLAACGGGGGGGGTGEGVGAAPGPAPAPPPASSEPGALGFTTANAGRAAGYPLFALHTALRAGQLVADELSTLGAAPPAESARDCQPSGRVLRSWADADGNGQLGPGDTVTLRFEGCARNPMTRSASGTARLTLQAADPAGGWTGRLQLPEPGLGMSNALGDPVDAEYRVSGDATLTRETRTAHDSLVLSASGSEGLTLRFGLAPEWPDRLTEMRLEKRLRWDEARIAVSATMRFDSVELGGHFQVNTPQPLLARLDSTPEPFAGQGRVEMRGRDGDLIVLRVAGTGFDALALELDQRGDGRIEATGGGSWFNVGQESSFLFADTSPGGRGGVYGHDPAEFSLRQLPQLPGPVAVDAALRLQFTRPPADEGWAWRLVQRRRIGSLGDTAVDVPVRVERLGALIVLHPLAPLRHSHEYEVVVATGDAVGSAQRLSARTGGSLLRPDGVLARFRTPDILNPRPSFWNADQTLTPDAPGQLWAAPQPEGAPPVQYRWTQLGGTPLLIEQPDAAQTSVRLAGTGSGIGHADLRLTLTLPTGETESADLRVRTLFDASGPWVTAWRVREPTLPDLGLASVWTSWAGPATGTLSATLSEGRLRLDYVETAQPGTLHGGWQLELRAPPGQALGPGRTTGAWSAAAVGAPAGAAGLEYTRRGIVFAPMDSEFEIVELETAPDGRVTKLALDVVVRGLADYGTAVGRVRIGSSVGVGF